MRRRLLVPTLLLVALALAAPASAVAANGVVTRTGTTIKVDFGAAVDSDSFFVTTSGSTIQMQENSDGTMSTSAADCTAVPPDRVNCTVSGATKLVVEMGGGGDYTEFLTFAVAVDVEVYGEGGDDLQLWGTGRDDLIDGGDGDDGLYGFGGDDTLYGGPGEDELEGNAETDDIHGGPGIDVVTFSGTDVKVSLDDLPNDGPAGDGDNVRSDVEDVEATNGDDELVGSAAGNILWGFNGNDSIDGGAGADIFQAGDGNDSIMSRDGLAELIDCGNGIDSVVADDIDVTDGCESEQRSSVLQTDLDGDGASRPVDCNDGNAAIRPGAPDVPDDGVDQNCDGADATDLDRDRDGFPRPVDCDDGNAAAHPGARERRGNRVDEDCNGRAEPFELVTNGVPNAWVTQGATTRNLALGVRDVRKRMTVQLRCRGGGCPFAKKTMRIKRRKRLLNLHPLLAGAALRPGAVLELRITKPQAIGKVVRYSVRSGAVPRSRALCLPPGKRKPREC
jgi:hypothetical protein